MKEKLSVEEIASVVQTEACFPLLCELYYSRENQHKDILKFFKEPVAVYEEEIRGFKGSCKGFYCVFYCLRMDFAFRIYRAARCRRENLNMC